MAAEGTAIVTAKSFDISGTVATLHVVHLPERARSQRVQPWLLQIELEKLLFQSEVANGRIYKCLSSLGMLNTVVLVNKAAVLATPQLITQQEFDAIMAVLGRSVRKCNLLPVPVAVSVLKSLGDGVRVRAIIQGIGQEVPRVWDLRAEAAANASRFEEDLLLTDELAAEEEAIEHEAKALTSELATHFEDFADDPEDEQTSRTYTLQRVSKELEAELKKFELFKVEALNRFRSGSACVDSTFENTKNATLRFMGWYKSYGPNAVPLRLATLFGHKRIGAWIEQYLRWCKGERGCKSSSMANYTSGLINTLQYVMATSEIEEDDAHGITNLEQALNLRTQLESQAREDRLYARRHPEFIEWPEVQATRVAVTRAWHNVPASASQETKRKALLELLCILFFSVSPPDRCGVVRRLKFNHTLKQDADGWVIDLTKFRHK